MGAEIPTNASDWHVNWAVPSTWIRLTLATMAISLGVSIAMLAAVFVDAIVIDLIARTGIFNWRGHQLVVDVVRMIVICVAISSVLAALIQGISRFLPQMRRSHSSADTADASEERKIRDVWGSVFFVVFLWSMLIVRVVENASPSIVIFRDEYKWVVFFIAFLFSWSFHIEKMFLKVVRSVLAERLSPDMAEARCAPFGPVGLARIFVIVATAVTVAVFGLVTALIPSG